MYNLADISGVHTMFELIPNHLVIKNKHGAEMHGKHVYIWSTVYTKQIVFCIAAKIPQNQFICFSVDMTYIDLYLKYIKCLALIVFICKNVSVQHCRVILLVFPVIT